MPIHLVFYKTKATCHIWCSYITKGVYGFRPLQSEFALLMIPGGTAMQGQPVAKAEQAPDTSRSSKNLFNIVVSQWESYIKVHTGEKPYKFLLCWKIPTLVFCLWKICYLFDSKSEWLFEFLGKFWTWYNFKKLRYSKNKSLR